MHFFDKVTKLELPPLTGTPSKIEWAHQIRERVALEYPDLLELKSRTAADWWIANRHRITPRRSRADEERDQQLADAQRKIRAAWRRRDH